MTKLSIKSCLLLLGSIASLGSAQPMSLKAELIQPRLGCNFLTCTSSILGESSILTMKSDFAFFILSFLGAVETCLHTGSAEEVIDCVKNILESIGKGDCKDCICDIIPQFCQEKMIEPTETKSLERFEAEAEEDSQLSCNFFTCSGAILGAVETCIHTGSAEEVIDCVKNILESIGKGDCKDCICDIIPQFCQA